MQIRLMLGSEVYFGSTGRHMLTPGRCWRLIKLSLYLIIETEQLSCFKQKINIKGFLR